MQYFVACNKRYITNPKAVQNPLPVLHLNIKQQHELLQSTNSVRPRCLLLSYSLYTLQAESFCHENN